MKKKDKKRYDRLKNKFYCQYNVINLKKAFELEDDLFKKGIYLPPYLLNVLSVDYCNQMKEIGMWEEINDELIKHKGQSLEENCREFVRWVNINGEFSDLLNSENLEQLQISMRLLDNMFKK